MNPVLRSERFPSQAFSTVELAEAKQRIVRLQDLQVQVDSTWRGSRWIMDVVSLARDRTMTGVGVPIASLSQQSSSVPLIQTPDDPAGNKFLPSLPASRSVSNASSAEGHQHQQHPQQGRIVGGISSGRHRVLVKTKSDNKMLDSVRGSTVESPTGHRPGGVARSRTPVCTECSVPLDLPGYVSSCSTCAGARAHYGGQTGKTSRLERRLCAPIFMANGGMVTSRSRGAVQAA